MPNDVIVFAGPSLTPSDRQGADHVTFRPPVGRGDVLRALRCRPRAIGVVDGVFGDAPAVLHKELLEAMSRGISVCGAASMGALRACELSRYGMVGIGRVFSDYASGRRTADADVAVLHGPAALHHQALTVPIVEVDETAEALQQSGHFSLSDAAKIRDAARRIFFADRTWSRLAEIAGREVEVAGLEALLRRHHVHRKRHDACTLLAAIGDIPVPETPPPALTLHYRRHLDAAGAPARITRRRPAAPDRR
ncbi:TfuA-like protein [Histidinibacterium aquaticum]|uniref:Antibiotic resistance protein n=1 Tax=Histidinibacterium aquaticum TaxID=2613962 RepID=A0A5J5GMG3_9RHOB|nr:TfuA-like protein [Histidinibacterium aquaticum]KAA9009481.1 antibiotic resistance protein [Histidinibacterium aquaticum]